MDMLYGEAQGVAVAEVGVVANGSGVTVMVDQATAGLAAAMRERYKFPNLELVQGETHSGELGGPDDAPCEPIDGHRR